jgi:hypothetical protein
MCQLPFPVAIASCMKRARFLHRVLNGDLVTGESAFLAFLTHLNKCGSLCLRIRHLP